MWELCCTRTPHTPQPLPVKGQVLPEDALTEVKHVIGKIGLVGQALPGSIELAEKVAECAIGHDNIFIEKHGVLICAQTLFDAFCTMDAIENASKSIILSKLL